MQTNDANIVPHKSLFVISPMIAVDFICLLRSTKMLVSFSLKFVACTFIYITKSMGIRRYAKSSLFDLDGRAYFE